MVPRSFYCFRINWIVYQEKKIAEDRLRMQRDFEVEQEKNRKKEEEVREIATTVIPRVRKNTHKC